MRLIHNFKKRGGRLVHIRDSITGNGGAAATWTGEPKDFWIKGDCEEVWQIEDGDPVPAPKEGWSYAKGFFG